MPVRIIICGPPNSGKSTFSECLHRALEDEEVNSYSEDLDLFAPTQKALRGEISWEAREELKHKPLSEKDFRESAKRFKERSEDYEVVIGDLPGEISPQSKILIKEATHAIILCREDEQEKIKDWKKIFKNENIEIVAIIISSLNGEVYVRDNDIIEARIINLNREKITVSPEIRAFASILRRRLGF